MGWPPGHVTTKDKRFIVIDSYARWRISDPIYFFWRLKNEVFAQSRLDDIIGGATRIAIAGVDLVEVVRSDKSRKAISNDILEDSREKVEGSGYGIELLDFQFKRITPVNPSQSFPPKPVESKKVGQ